MKKKRSKAEQERANENRVLKMITQALQAEGKSLTEIVQFIENTGFGKVDKGRIGKWVTFPHRRRLRGVWKDIFRRCYDSNNDHYFCYGKRGITICQEWHDFDKFYQWSIDNGYQEGLSIDRIHNDGNYSPLNCKWSTSHEQAKNRSNSNPNVGVCFNKKMGMYRVSLDVNGKRILCKYYKTQAEAVQARKQAELQYGIYPKCASTTTAGCDGKSRHSIR